MSFGFRLRFFLRVRDGTARKENRRRSFSLLLRRLWEKRQTSIPHTSTLIIHARKMRKRYLRFYIQVQRGYVCSIHSAWVGTTKMCFRARRNTSAERLLYNIRKKNGRPLITFSRMILRAVRGGHGGLRRAPVCVCARAKVELVRARRFYIYRELFLPQNNIVVVVVVIVVRGIPAYHLYIV